jgi:hypothetical protein
MYGHIQQLAEAEKAGIEKAGGTADIFQYVFHHQHLQRTQITKLTNDIGSLRPSPRRC